MCVGGSGWVGGSPGLTYILNNSCAEMWTRLNWHKMCSMAGFFEPDNKYSVYTKKTGNFHVSISQADNGARSC